MGIDALKGKRIARVGELAEKVREAFAGMELGR